MRCQCQGQVSLSHGRRGKLRPHLHTFASPFRSTGDTALHLICSTDGGDEKQADDFFHVGKRILGEYQADVNVQNNEKKTALHVAILSGRQKLIDLLLEQPNIDVNLRSSDEKCALELALSGAGEPPFELAKRLLEEKAADPNPIYDSQEENLFQLLIQRDLQEAALFLAQQAGTDLKHRNARGEWENGLNLA